MINENLLIVGGGLPGLFAALFYSEKFQDKKIKIIERSNKLGGLFGSTVHKNAGVFDHGMHILYTTTNPEIDRYLKNCLSDEEWCFLEGNNKDIAGVHYNGQLETKSPYIHLENVPKKYLNQSVNDLFGDLNHPAPLAIDCDNAEEFFTKRFGQSLANKIIDPILLKLWGYSGKDLSPMATKLVLMDRLNFFSHDAMLDLVKSSLIRGRLGFPDQLRLPSEYRNAQIGLYPKKFGINFLIERIAKILESRGVEIMLETELSGIEIFDNRIESVNLTCKSQNYKISNVKNMLWTSPLYPLQKLCKTGNNPLPKMDPPKIQKSVYFLLKNPPNMDNLYYFFCYDKGFKAFRITNYSAYCEDAIRPKTSHFGTSYPLCVEMHFPNDYLKIEEKTVKLATEELLKLGVIKDKTEILFSFSGEQKAGFPILTKTNIEIQSIFKKNIMDLDIKNMLVAGQEPEKGIFFLHEVLEKLYPKVNSF